MLQLIAQEGRILGWIDRKHDCGTACRQQTDGAHAATLFHDFPAILGSMLYGIISPPSNMDGTKMSCDHSTVMHGCERIASEMADLIYVVLGTAMAVMGAITQLNLNLAAVYQANADVPGTKALPAEGVFLTITFVVAALVLLLGGRSRA